METSRAGHKPRKRDLGEPPGTLSAAPGGEPPLVQVMAFGPDAYEEADVCDIETLPGYLERWPVTWINVFGLGDVNLVRRLGELFNLHHLALEDVLHLQQRSKVEEYDDQLFYVVRMIDAVKVDTEQLAIFLGDRYVITFQEHLGDSLDGIRRRIREGRGRVRTMPADYLAYCLLDAVIDAYYPHLDEFSDRIEALEDEVLECPTTDSLAHIHQFRRDILTVRRAMSPLRDAVSALLNGGFEARIQKQTRVYLRDCYDHTVQILDLAENYRELASGLLEVYLSSASNRMNDVMKVLTMMSTLFIPLSFLTGVYGMNFDTAVSPFNMPELEWFLGYPFFWAIAVGIALLEFWFFRHRGWLSGTISGTPKPRRKKHPGKSGADGRGLTP
jgi:magnesium transporter